MCILRVKLEAQVEPQEGPANEQRGFPRCIAMVPRVAALHDQQRTPITLYKV